MNKKDKEVEIGKFLADKINAKHGLDYIVRPNENEGQHDGDVDVYLISLLEKTTLKVQITTQDGFLLEQMAKNRRRSDQGQEQEYSVLDMGPEIYIKRVIDKKTKRYSSHEDIVLVVCSEWGSQINENYVKENFPALASGDFRAIYWIRMPSYPETASHPHDGQVVAIRALYGSDGETI